jgi:hypothetical protein
MGGMLMLTNGGRHHNEARAAGPRHGPAPERCLLLLQLLQQRQQVSERLAASGLVHDGHVLELAVQQQPIGLRLRDCTVTEAWSRRRGHGRGRGR